VIEIPIEFRDRQHGQSKLSLQEQANYVRHVARLLRTRCARTENTDSQQCCPSCTLRRQMNSLTFTPLDRLKQNVKPVASEARDVPLVRET
jgi:hypothetical protein